jgi:hypothetical protein
MLFAITGWSFPEGTGVFFGILVVPDGPSGQGKRLPLVRDFDFPLALLRRKKVGVKDGKGAALEDVGRVPHAVLREIMKLSRVEGRANIRTRGKEEAESHGQIESVSFRPPSINLQSTHPY